MPIFLRVRDPRFNVRFRTSILEKFPWRDASGSLTSPSVGSTSVCNFRFCRESNLLRSRRPLCPSTAPRFAANSVLYRSIFNQQVQFQLLTGRETVCGQRRATRRVSGRACYGQNSRVALVDFSGRRGGGGSRSREAIYIQIHGEEHLTNEANDRLFRVAWLADVGARSGEARSSRYATRNASDDDIRLPRSSSFVRALRVSPPSLPPPPTAYRAVFGRTFIAIFYTPVSVSRCSATYIS